MLNKSLRVFFLFALALSVSSCGVEPVGTGELVSIPRVYIDCTTTRCKTPASPMVLVVFTTSGCDNIDYGSTISASTHAITCNGSTGCRGEISRSSWINNNGVPVSSLPSGVYSVCGLVDYNRSYPPSANGDSVGFLDNVAVVEGMGPQIIVDWTDI